MDNIPIDVVRLADSSDEPYNKYKKTNEDRLNANFRRLKEASEQNESDVAKHEAALRKLLTATSTTPTSSHTITQATVNTFGLSGATITEVNAVVLLTTAASNGSVLLSGLPKAKYGTYYLAFCGGDANGTTYALKYGNQSDYADIQSAQSIASGTTVRMHLVYFSM